MKKKKLSAPQLVNSNDGRNIDRSSEIAEKYHGYREVLKTYFRDKEYSIRRYYREDDNSAAAESVTASGLHSWQENRDDLLDQLSEQIDDVFDLASVKDSIRLRQWWW